MARLPAAVRCLLAVSVVATATTALLCAQTVRTPMKDTRNAAEVMQASGRVVVQRDSPWRLAVGDYVYPNEVVSTGSDGSALFKVADGSTFEVFPNSQVNFRANNMNWEDLLELWLGKIKVQIEHPGGVLPNNNKVRTPTAVISVRGTTFGVEYDAEKGATTVYDEEGSVEVARATRLDDKRILNANESIVVYKNSTLAPKFDTGGLLKRVYQSVMDAITQEAINSRSSAPSAPGTPAPSVTTPPPTSPGDHNGNTPPPPPPPAPSN
jgi:hypothetical protein